jgi:hypothetical protein
MHYGERGRSRAAIDRRVATSSSRNVGLLSLGPSEKIHLSSGDLGMRPKGLRLQHSSQGGPDGVETGARAVGTRRSNEADFCPFSDISTPGESVTLNHTVRAIDAFPTPG